MDQVGGGAKEGAIKRSLLHDISTFLRTFPSDSFIKYSDFRSKWDDLDFNLLVIVTGTDTIVTCLIQLGLFVPTRHFRDHQLLVFFLFSLYKAVGRRSLIKVSADRMQFLVGLRMSARRMAGEGGEEIVAALEALFKVEAFVITVDEDESGKYILSSSCPSAFPPSSTTSVDQLIDRIARIDTFLHQNPLLTATGSSLSLSRTALIRLKDSFERYYESKKRNSVILGDEQDLGTLLGSVGRIVEGYEKLIQKRKLFAPSKSSSTAITTTQTSSQSIRSRLSQSSLSPIIPSSASSPLFIPQISMPTSSRAQSVPVGQNKRRASSNLKEIDLDEFLDTSNMPNLNFY